jgi:hypothetical protein
LSLVESEAVGIRQRPHLRRIGLVVYEISEFTVEFFGVTIHRKLPDERRKLEMVPDLVQVGRVSRSSAGIVTTVTTVATVLP